MRIKRSIGKNKNPHRQTLKHIFSNILFMLKIAFRIVPFYPISNMLEGLVWGGANSVGLIYTKILYERLEMNGAQYWDVARIVIYMILYQAIFWIVYHIYWEIVVNVQKQKLYGYVHTWLFEVARKVDLSSYDNPNFYNDFKWAMMQSDSTIVALVQTLGQLISQSLSIVTIGAVLMTIDPIFAMISIVACILLYVYQKIVRPFYYKYSLDFNEVNRKAEYTSRVLQDPAYAKEIRVTHAKEVLFDKYEESQNEIYEKSVWWAKKGFKYQLANILLFSGIGPLVNVMLLYKVMVSKTVTVGGYAAASNAIWSFQSYINKLMSIFSNFARHSLYIDKVRKFLEYTPQVRTGTKPAEPFEKIEFRNVSFGYNAEVTVLHNIDFTLHKGEKIAIVGYNGAGKSTFIKLLMHLYDPTSGEIVLNGNDIGDYDSEAYRERIGAVFQDYQIFATTVAENVLADEFKEGDEERVKRALHLATFDDRLESLPNGIQTYLTKEFHEDGVNLSGGEAQKIAIARVFAQDYDLIIMDEPSSALDPIAEYELNNNIQKYAKDKTVVFISHRLSTTRRADRIYMFEDGRIVEVGTHKELMQLDGKYAEMFNMQAEKYRM